MLEIERLRNQIKEFQSRLRHLESEVPAHAPAAALSDNEEPLHKSPPYFPSSSAQSPTSTAGDIPQLVESDGQGVLQAGDFLTPHTSHLRCVCQ